MSNEHMIIINDQHYCQFTPQSHEAYLSYHLHSVPGHPLSHLLISRYLSGYSVTGQDMVRKHTVQYLQTMDLHMYCNICMYVRHIVHHAYLL